MRAREKSRRLFLNNRIRYPERARRIYMCRMACRLLHLRWSAKVCCWTKKKETNRIEARSVII